MKKITLFVMDADEATEKLGDKPSDAQWVHEWILKWKRVDQLRVVDYSSGGWEYLWDIEASDAAVAEVPESYFCDSEWSNPEIFEPKNKTKK